MAGRLLAIDEPEKHNEKSLTIIWKTTVSRYQVTNSSTWFPTLRRKQFLKPSEDSESEERALDVECKYELESKAHSALVQVIDVLSLKVKKSWTDRSRQSMNS